LRLDRRRAAAVLASIKRWSGSSIVVFMRETIWLYGWLSSRGPNNVLFLVVAGHEEGDEGRTGRKSEE